MGKVLGLVYGVLAYVVFLASFLYAVGFVGNFLVPRTIDQGPRTDLVTALPVDFGLRQAYVHLRGKVHEPPGFVSRGFYRMVRHPIMLGFILAFWAAPTMTLGHLVFAIATTAYILIGVRLEERDLLAMLGDSYDRYRRRVPMLIPWSRK